MGLRTMYCCNLRPRLNWSTTRPCWYVNGLSKATGSNTNPSYTAGSGLAAGIYRLDVTAISSDGMRVGAATTTFKVQ